MSDNNVISVGAFDSEESFDVWLSGLDGEFKKKVDRYLDFLVICLLMVCFLVVILYFACFRLMIVRFNAPSCFCMACHTPNNLLLRSMLQ